MSKGFLVKDLIEYYNYRKNYKRTEEDLNLQLDTVTDITNNVLNDFKNIRGKELPFIKEAAYKVNIEQLTNIIKNAHNNNYLSRLVKGVVNELSNPNNAKLRYYNVNRFNEIKKIAEGGYGSIYQLGRDNNFPIIIKDQVISTSLYEEITYLNFYQEIYNSLRVNSLRDKNLTPNFYYFIDYHITPNNNAPDPIGKDMKRIGVHMSHKDKYKTDDNDDDDEVNIELIGSIIYEKIDGIPLRSISNILSEEDFLSIFMQIAISLHIAKVDINFTHSDLHDSNILLKPLDREEQIKYKDVVGYDMFVKTKYIAYIIDYGFTSVDKHINLILKNSYIDDELEGISRDLFYLLLSIGNHNIKNLKSYKVLMRYYLSDYENLPEDFNFIGYYFPKGFYKRNKLKKPIDEFIHLFTYIFYNLGDIFSNIMSNKGEFIDIPMANCTNDCYRQFTNDLYSKEIIKDNLYYYWLINNNVILSNESDNNAIIDDLTFYNNEIIKMYFTEVKYNNYELLLMIIREILNKKKKILSDNEKHRYKYLYEIILENLHNVNLSIMPSKYADEMFELNKKLISSI